MKKVCERCGGTGHEPDPRKLGSFLAAKRSATGLCQAEVARRLGFSRAHLCRLESGKRGWTYSLSLRYLRALA